MSELTPMLIALMAFGCVTAIVFVVGRYLTSQASMHRRLPIHASGLQSADLADDVVPNYFLASLTGKIDEKRFGIEGPLRVKLRRDLVRAGYFSDQAVRLYILARLAVVLMLPTIVYVLIQIFFSQISFYPSLGILAVTVMIAVLGPDAFISRRQTRRQGEYRLVFPDLIDMLVVCVDAGLSLDAAFTRIRPEITKQSRAMGMNLTLLAAETRAGRSTADALGTFADRLNIDEARAFLILLRQSLELGTDVGAALRVFSDEMRGKRLLRAEETANKLPVKMVLPLGAFIFPVILMVVLVPVLIRLWAVAQTRGR
jgi:tight adherence protein C